MHTGISKPVWFLVLLGAIAFSSGVFAAPRIDPQTPKSRIPPPADKGSADDEGPPLTTFEEEMRAKRLIKQAEKEHKENLARAREIAQLAKELQSGLKTSNTLDRDGIKRVERLEKLTKKIRGEAGGEDDEVQILNRPGNQSGAVAQIAEVAESLAKSVQDTPRQVVNASVIDSANVLLELIRLLRTFAQ